MWGEFIFRSVPKWEECRARTGPSLQDDSS
jgi:hypothetical protein